MDKIIKKEAAKSFNVSEDRVIVLHRLPGGMSNYTYVMSIGGTKMTYRIPGKNSEKFVNRQIEEENLEIIKPLNLNNETLYLNTENGHRAATYVEGKVLSEDQPLNHLDAVAQALKKIHQSGLKATNDYAPYQRLEQYENHLKAFNHNHGTRYDNIKKAMVEHAKRYKDIPLTLTHGDTQPSNLVMTDEKLYVLDWEFCGNNDPYYDIACFGNIDFSYALALLNVYLDREATEQEKARLYYHRLFQCMQWHNVALYKEFIGLSEELHIPFDKVAEAYLTKAEGFLSHLEQCLSV